MSEIISWNYEQDSTIREDAVRGMDHRAVLEAGIVAQGKDITEVHGERLREAPILERFLEKACLVMGSPFRGVGADLGAGTATLAAILSRYPSVDKVFAVEYSRETVEKIMPLTFHRLKADSRKITRVVGSFNQMRFEDNSLDFAVEVLSFHHSEDIGATLREAHRALKQGGWLVTIEKAWPNHLHTAILESRLDAELVPDLKERYGIPLDQRFSRRMWGEHEYRVCDWVANFAAAGFETFAFYFLRKRKKPFHYVLKVASWFVGDALLRHRVDHSALYPWFGKRGAYGKLLIVARKP